MRVLLAAFLLFLGTMALPAHAQDTNATNDQANAAENVENGTTDADTVEANQTGDDEGTNQAPPSDSDAGEDVVGDSGEALVKLFVLAVLLEFALSLIFNWRPFVVKFDGRGVKTVVSFAAALVVVYALKPDAVIELMGDYGRTPTGSSAQVARIIEAMIIAGGSAGVYNLLVALGIRSARRREQVVPEPKSDEAWISVGLREKTKVAGPVDVMITEKGKTTEYLGTINAALKQPGLRSYFVRDPERIPPSGGITLQPGIVYTVEAKGKDNAGSELTGTWGPHALAKRAVIDIKFDM